jgi:hypothetical protein
VLERAWAIDVAGSTTARNAIVTPRYLFAARRAPEHLRGEIGPECVAQEIEEGMERPCVRDLPPFNSTTSRENPGVEQTKGGHQCHAERRNWLSRSSPSFGK